MRAKLFACSKRTLFVYEEAMCACDQLQLQRAVASSVHVKAPTSSPMDGGIARI